MAEVFTTRSLVHAIAGSAAGCWAISVFYPLNLVRTRTQLERSGKAKSVFAAMKSIADNEGAAALYVGLWSNVFVLGCSNFVYFYLYNGLRAALLAQKRRRGKPQEISAKLNLILSSLAGTVNVMVTSPLWVAAMRITTQQRKPSTEKQQEFQGVLDTMGKITAQEGITALWNGAGASLILVSNPVVQFVAYEWVKKLRMRLQVNRGYAIHGIEFFLMGAFAKAVATVLTYPIQLAQTRLRGKEHEKNGKGYTGIRDCLTKTVQREGFLGMFRGMEAKLWQTVLTAAFHFLAYEKIILAVQSLARWRSMHKRLA